MQRVLYEPLEQHHSHDGGGKKRHESLVLYCARFTPEVEQSFHV